MRRVLMAWSGGKDSALALAALRNTAPVEVVGLLTTVTTDYDRVSIHGSRLSILYKQAERLGLPLFLASISSSADNAAYEAAWANAVETARSSLGNITSLAYGDLFLEDIRAYRERQCAAIQIEPLFPIWGQPTHALAQRIIAERYEAYLTCVDTTQLDASFSGRRFDATLLSDLPETVDPCGERGEFHTCVVDSPLFPAAIPVRLGRSLLRLGRFQYSDLEDYEPA